MCVPEESQLRVCDPVPPLISSVTQESYRAVSTGLGLVSF